MCNEGIQKNENNLRHFLLLFSGVSSFINLFFTRKTGVFVGPKHCFRPFVVYFQNGKKLHYRGGWGGDPMADQLIENALDFVHFFWIPSLETKE